MPQLPAVRTRTTCRVLIVSREEYRQVAASFPLSARAVLDNLLRDAEQAGHPPACFMSLLCALPASDASQRRFGTGATVLSAHACRAW